MHISIIIPAHNEATFLSSCLDSFVAQTLQPTEVIIVDDNSTDDTYTIASSYAKKHNWIRVIQRQSTDAHIPGKKVIDTFNFGLETISNCDLLGKFDADIILPPDYFEKMILHFKKNAKLGMCAGLLYIEKNGQWVYENIANKSHIRGPLKLYLKSCFDTIGGLKPAVGWDTVDTLLVQYHQYELHTDPSLQVKHLRPTGQGYTSQKNKVKGEALYRMRYGFTLAILAGLKMALQSRNLPLFFSVIQGYFSGKSQRLSHFATEKEGAFIRNLRWKGILSKIGF